MSDSELQELFNSVDSVADQQEVIDDLERVDDLLNELQKEEAAAPVVFVPTVRWKKRGSDGNLIHARPRSSNQSTQGQYCCCIHDILKIQIILVTHLYQIK